MRSALYRRGEVVVDDVADPVPAMGQVLVRTLACGICGSDLHFVQHAESLVEVARQAAGPSAGAMAGSSAGPMAGPSWSLDLSRDVYMGHEFCAEVVAPGPDTLAPAPGTVVTSIPGLLTLEGPEQLAYSNRFPGGYSEYMLLSPVLLLEVPNGLAAEYAALTEPMAVGIHAVAKSGITPAESALVLGCGPIGLAVVAGLRLLGVESIVAADYSPTRRALATGLGAAGAVDPGAEPPIEAWRRVDGRRPLVVFEAVGVPGMLTQAIADCPPGGRVLVVGACMQEDSIHPALALAKELCIQFSMAYTPEEFAGSLRAIAEGKIDVAPLITGSVGIDGVPGAFAELADPERHCKILVVPAG